MSYITINYNDVEMDVTFHTYEDEITEDFGLGSQTMSRGTCIEIEKVEILVNVDITSLLSDKDLDGIAEQISWELR